MPATFEISMVDIDDDQTEVTIHFVNVPGFKRDMVVTMPRLDDPQQKQEVLASVVAAATKEVRRIMAKRRRPDHEDKENSE
jgi:hypothetical protein